MDDDWVGPVNVLPRLEVHHAVSADEALAERMLRPRFFPLHRYAASNAWRSSSSSAAARGRIGMQLDGDPAV